MKTITIDTEKILTMCVSNADRKQNSLYGDTGRIAINALEHVDYIHLNPGTHYQNCHMVDPEDFLDIVAVEANYNLDITEFQTDARDAVCEENNTTGDHLTDADHDKISEYVSSYIAEWKAWARLNKNDVLVIADAEGAIVDEYSIEWV